ncbi:MAG: hypothetical protein ACREON_03085 [Gemmatimonadaceae bacterium]
MTSSEEPSSLRRRSAALLDRAGLRQPMRRALMRLLDAVGAEDDWLHLSVEELAARVIARSANTLDELPSLRPGHRVLIFSGRNVVNTHWLNDGMLAWALRLRGADARIILCDEALSCCELATLNHYDEDDAILTREKPVTCVKCYQPASCFLEAFQLPVHRYGEFVGPGVRERARAFVSSLSRQQLAQACYRGVDIGEHATSTACRVLLRGTLDFDDPFTEATLRRLLENAVVMVEASQGALAHFDPEHVVAHHGIYLTGGIPAACARQRGAHVVTWSVIYRKHCTLWSHDDTYHRTVALEPNDAWATRPLDSVQARRLDDYLETHWKPGGSDWISYNRDHSGDSAGIAKELGLDGSHPVAAIFTNIQWDAKIWYTGIAFEDHRDWLLSTVRYALDRPDVQWVIRAHPAEMTHSVGPAREKVAEVIRTRFPDLPDHIRIVGSDNSMSSYALMELLDVAIVYGTTLGTEMAVKGIPVVVAGDAWYRGKGFTLDPIGASDYFAMLDQIGNGLSRLSAGEVELARRYAYHLVFRRMIPFPMLRGEPGVHHVRRLDDLRPGRNLELDVICDGVLQRRPFAAPT